MDNQKSPCWKAQEDLKALNWDRVKVHFPQVLSVPKQQASDDKNKPRELQKGDLKCTVLLYSLSSFKYLILLFNSVITENNKVSG